MRAQLIIADISGYTRFLTESELEHANGIIGDLLNTIVGAIEFPLRAVEIEGDAVFMSAVLPEGTNGQTMIEGVEALYIAFASALETMVFNTTCPCAACANCSSLGLKIVMHCGDVARSEIAGHEKISGPAVIAVHRLLKNSIREATGVDDYLFITDDCVHDLGVEDIVGGWASHAERYEHVGQIRGRVSSLSAVWQRSREREDAKVAVDGAWMTIRVDTPAPAWVVWDHIIDPDKRTAWLAAEGNRLSGVASGRIDLQTAYHCAHGNDWNTVSTVVGLRAPEFLTLDWDLANGWLMRYTDLVVQNDAGVTIISTAMPLVDIKTGEPAPQELLDQLAPGIEANYEQALHRLGGMATDAAGQV